jgi:hypothetical protein
MVFGSGFPYKLYQTFFLINEFSSSPANIQKKIPANEITPIKRRLLTSLLSLKNSPFLPSSNARAAPHSLFAGASSNARAAPPSPFAGAALACPHAASPRLHPLREKIYQLPFRQRVEDDKVSA